MPISDIHVQGIKKVGAVAYSFPETPWIIYITPMKNWAESVKKKRPDAFMAGLISHEEIHHIINRQEGREPSRWLDNPLVLYLIDDPLAEFEHIHYPARQFARRLKG